LDLRERKQQEDGQEYKVSFKLASFTKC